MSVESHKTLDKRGWFILLFPCSPQGINCTCQNAVETNVTLLQASNAYNKLPTLFNTQLSMYLHVALVLGEPTVIFCLQQTLSDHLRRKTSLFNLSFSSDKSSQVDIWCTSFTVMKRVRAVQSYYFHHLYFGCRIIKFPGRGWSLCPLAWDSSNSDKL